MSTVIHQPPKLRIAVEGCVSLSPASSSTIVLDPSSNSVQDSDHLARAMEPYTLSTHQWKSHVGSKGGMGLMSSLLEVIFRLVLCANAITIMSQSLPGRA